MISFFLKKLTHFQNAFYTSIKLTNNYFLVCNFIWDQKCCYRKVISSFENTNHFIILWISPGSNYTTECQQLFIGFKSFSMFSTTKCSYQINAWSWIEFIFRSTQSSQFLSHLDYFFTINVFLKAFQHSTQNCITLYNKKSLQQVNYSKNFNLISYYYFCFYVSGE